MLSRGGTATCTATRTTYTVVVVDSGWRDATIDDLATIEIKEPAQQEQDEPDTGERLVYWERPNRRLATVTGLRRNKQVPQQASTYG
jgi:hypothetical protein